MMQHLMWICSIAGNVKSGSISINPKEIRYSQSFVNGSSNIIQSMKKTGWRGDTIDADGNYTGNWVQN